MDRNFFLAVVLSFLVVMLWLQWQEARYGEARRLAEQEAAAPPATEEPSAPALPTTPPEIATLPRAPVVPPALGDPSPPAAAAAVPERIARVSTPRYEARLTSRGGGLRSWTLSDYVDRSQGVELPVDLVGPLPDGLVALFTPFDELGLGDLSQASYELDQPASDVVVFTHERSDVRIRKRYEFGGDSYDFRLTLELTNLGASVFSPTFSVGWPIQSRPGSDFADQSLVALQAGSVNREALSGLGKPGFFSRSPSPPPVFEGNVEWAGADTRYFLSVLLPKPAEDALGAFLPRVPGEQAVAFVGYRPFPIAPGQSITRIYEGYLGPKEPEQLAAVGAQLERSVQLGWSFIAPLARLFNWLLHALYGVIPNYGVAIILVTILVKLVTAPLTNTSMRSMQRMAALQPRMREIQEKYKEDRQRQSEELMKLYREAGANPLTGCLPMLLQFPFFIALYYALQSSIDLRQAYFFGWIEDLSVPEALFTLPGLDLPVRVLPLVMGGTMVLSQKLTPSTMDPTQARMMMTVMPVMFTVLFYQFPSGLVLYWLVNNVLQIAQQVYMNRKREREEAK